MCILALIIVICFFISIAFTYAKNVVITLKKRRKFDIYIKRHKRNLIK